MTTDRLTDELIHGTADDVPHVTQPDDYLGERTEADERAALAARVNGSPPDSEQAVRAEYGSVQRQLAELREERLRINDRIRDLVARDELLVKVVRLYDRAAAAEQDDAE